MNPPRVLLLDEGVDVSPTPAVKRLKVIRVSLS